MPIEVSDKTFDEILYDYQLLYQEELEEMFNTTASDTAIKEKLELIALIKYIRNENKED